MSRIGFSRTQILILVSVWLTFLISFVMRLSWASLMPIVNEALNFTPQMGTSYLSAFYMGYAIMVLPGGILADRIGYRHTILVSLLAMAVITALMSTIDNYTYGWVLRFLLGIVSGPVQASCLSAIGDYFGPNQRGAAVGIFMSCTSLGVATVNLYAPYVATNYGWQNAFLLTAMLPVLIFILSYFTVKKNHLTALVMFLFGPALILFASTTNPDMLFITGPILGIGAFMHSALTNALVVQSAEPHLRGTTAGFVNLFNQIGVMLAPMILGSMLTATGSYKSALMTLAIAPVIGAVALFFVRLKK